MRNQPKTQVNKYPRKNLARAQNTLHKRRLKLFIFLWIGCMLGALAVLPYAFYSGLLASFDGKVILNSLVFTAILYASALSLSYLTLRKVELNPFQSPNVLSGIFWGFCVGLAILFLEQSIFSYSTLAKEDKVPIWTRILASFYGGYNEEVLCRLFLLTGFYFIIDKLVKNLNIYQALIPSLATLVVAFVFAVGHLPALFVISPSPSSFEIARVIVLNALPGIVFGWLYWCNGFWTAAMAHFVADLVVHVLGSWHSSFCK